MEKGNSKRFLLLNSVLAFGLAAIVIFFRRFDALMLGTIVPIIWAAFRYDRKTYQLIGTLNTLLSVFVVYQLFPNPARSLQTVVICALTIFSLSEALYRVVLRSRQLERQLSRSEEKFRQIAEHIPQIFWLADRENYLYLSPAFARIWGISIPSGGFSRKDFLARVIEEDREQVEQFFALQFQSQQQIEYRVRCPDGSTRLIRDNAFPVTAHPGEGERSAGVAADITAQRALEDELRHAQKMEVLGKMAASAAHDFNNVLTVIQSYAYLLKSKMNPADQREALSQIELAVERAATLSKRLLSFTRKQKPVRKVADLNEILQSMSAMILKLLDKRVKLQFHPWPMPLPIKIDQGMLEHAILNLVTNARDAMPNGGTITIATATSIQPSPANPANRQEFASLTVADTGSGIPQDVLKKIFEPFFTTKPLGKGTGLGLATVERTARENHGNIDVTSTLGRGTTFKLLFPIVSAPVEERRDKPTETDFFARDERIVLLVEDESEVRAVTKRVLMAAGYNVLDCGSCLRALDLWTVLKEQVGLLILNVSLTEGFSAHEFVREVRKENPRLPILYTTSDLAYAPPDKHSKAFTRPCAPGLLLAGVKQLLRENEPIVPNISSATGTATVTFDQEVTSNTFSDERHSNRPA